ncbi:MAG: thioredoxin-like domain-containing protein, partial [Verrucomicrobiota bacterium]
KGNDVPISTLDDKVIGIYFSASWCGPCRRFTPSLVKYREMYKDDFEVIFVSSDRSASAQADYMKKYDMKWPAVKYEAKERKILQQIYQVSGIPKLVLLNTEGETLTPEGRNMISQKVPIEKLKTARIVEETFKCGKCSKDHKRKKLVYDGQDGS